MLAKVRRPLLHQMRVHPGRGEDHGDPSARRRLVLVGQEQLALARADGGFGFGADAGDRRAQRLGAAGDVEGAVDDHRLPRVMRLQQCPVLVGEDRRIEHHDAVLPRVMIEDVAEIGEARLEAHHPRLAQRVDRRIGHLAEILPEEMAEHPRIIRDHRERRVVAHAADRLLGVVDHGCEQQLHVLHRQPGGDLPPAQFGAAQCRRGLGRIMAGQIGEIAEPRHPFAIGCGGGDAVLDRAVVVERRSSAAVAVEVDRDHLAGPQTALLEHRRLGDHDHPGFRADDQQMIAGQRVAHRPQRVAVEPGDHPAAVGHGERGGTVPCLHDAGEIGVHRAVRVGQRLDPRPGFGDQQQLGGRRVAARADQRLEHRVECRGVAGARRDQRLDVLRMLAEGGRCHLDLVAFHPVLVAADGVDLAVVREAAERLRQPPLREGVGRIALVIDGEARHEALVLQIGIEHRQLLGEEQPLVDDRPRRQRADVETLDLRFDDLLLDAPADQEQVLLERRHRRQVERPPGARPGDHDLLDLGARLHRLVADDAYVDRHLPPAVDGVAEADDLGLDDGAAGFLRRQVGARQEDHPDRGQIGLGPVAGALDVLVEEVDRNLDMDAGTVAGLAVGVDRAAVPDGLQRVDRRADDTPAGLAVGGGDQPDAAGIGLELGPVHADLGDARAFGWITSRHLPIPPDRRTCEPLRASRAKSESRPMPN